MWQTEFVKSPKYFFKVPLLSKRFYGLFHTWICEINLMDWGNIPSGTFYRSQGKTGTGCETLIFCLVLERQRKTQKFWVCFFLIDRIQDKNQIKFPFTKYLTSFLSSHLPKGIKTFRATCVFCPPTSSPARIHFFILIQQFKTLHTESFFSFSYNWANHLRNWCHQFHE